MDLKNPAAVQKCIVQNLHLYTRMYEIQDREMTTKKKNTFTS